MAQIRQNLRSPIKNDPHILDVDLSVDDDMDVWFKSYVLSNPCKCGEMQPVYYTLTQEDVYNFTLAISKFSDITFKTGDYLIVSNSVKSKYSVYLFTTSGWISFRGKDAYDSEEGDVDLIFDEDDDE